MTDFETTLAERLTDLVDHEAGPIQTAPPFVRTMEPDEDRHPAWTRWGLVAAVIVLVAGLTWASVTAVTSRSGPQIAGPSATVAPATPTSTSPTGTTTPVIHSIPQTTGMNSEQARMTLEAAGFTVVDRGVPSSSPAGTYLGATCTESGSCFLDYSNGPSAPVAGATDLGGSTVVIPTGWVIAPHSAVIWQGGRGRHWCIDRVGAEGQCAIRLDEVDPVDNVNVDVEAEGGTGHGDTPWCSSPMVRRSTMDVADVRSFGGREAEHRVWTHRCDQVVVTTLEQYVVDYSPAWVLSSEKADPTVSQVMASIATASTLEAQALPLRLYDQGIVKAMRNTQAGLVVTLDRVYGSDPTAMVNNAATTYEYTLPAAVIAQGYPVTLGCIVAVYTDGRNVASYGVIR